MKTQNIILFSAVTHYSLWLLLHRHCHRLCVESVCCIELKREIKLLLLLLLVCNLHHLFICEYFYDGNHNSNII